MILLEWDDPSCTTLRYTFVDPWTWDEYHATNPQRDAMFAQTSAILDIILDFTHGQHIPEGAMTHFYAAASWDRPQKGIVAVIGVNTVLRILSNIMEKVSPQPRLKLPYVARDLAAARAIIERAKSNRLSGAAP